MNYNMLLYSFAVSNVIMISNTLNYVLLNWISWSFWKKNLDFLIQNNMVWNPWRCSLLFTIVSQPFWRNPVFTASSVHGSPPSSAQKPSLRSSLSSRATVRDWKCDWGSFELLYPKHICDICMCVCINIYIYFYINI